MIHPLVKGTLTDSSAPFLLLLMILRVVDGVLMVISMLIVFLNFSSLNLMVPTPYTGSTPEETVS